MAGRREVNVDRPEHSWIPFYRELAEKLVKDGWRERQGELVGVLKEMRDEGVMMHSVLNYLDEWVDPFTIYAIIARDLTLTNYQGLLSAYKSKFRLVSSLPKEKPFIPFANAQNLGFFPGEGDIPRYVSDLWDLFELIWDMDPISQPELWDQFAEQFDTCKRIHGVGTAKLSGAFYIVNPESFLKNDTINGILGEYKIGYNSTGKDYIDGLIKARHKESRPFPELNIAIYNKSYEPIKSPEDAPGDQNLVSDSVELDWVDFHLEVKDKLVEGEWWREEKREEMVGLIQRLREADPGGTTEVNATFDPFNLYQAFCQRDFGSAREQCLEILRDKLGLVSDLPSTDSRIWSIPSSRRINETLRGDRLDAFWEMLQGAIEMDPANDRECRGEFAERYNRVHAAGDRRQWWRILSTWLHLIDPTKFVHLHRLEKLGILDELRLGYYAGGGGGGWANGYVRALVRARELADQAGLTLLALNSESTTREMLYPDESTPPGGSEPYTLDHMLDDGLFFEPSELQRILDRFLDKKNLILQGPPGVGKTFVSKRLAYALMGERADGRIRNVQFHQSYSYEEFVQGYRPTTNANDELKFELQDGTFLKLCDLAFEASQTNPDLKFVMIIDEINRGNLSRVFGELLSMIEKDKRGGKAVVELQSGDQLSVPENVYILGTMNLADRSLAGMDYAMRRRFAFVTLEPQFGESVFEDWLRGRNVPDTMIERINSRMSALNEVIASDSSLGRNFAVGHSYFCDIADGGEDDWDGWYREIVETEIQPLLEEYWFDNLGKADEEVEKLLDGVPENGESNDNRS